jgi:DNA topoisomerase-3
LLEIILPPELEHAKKRWLLNDLPLLPARFELAPVKDSDKQLKLLLGLLKRMDVTGVINACDAGREGELIFHYIMRYANCRKPVERLWLQSMTSTAIRDSFQRLRTGKSMEPLADAAVSRSEADWLVGINGTRGLTVTETKRQTTSVGRVQTPTLALIVNREQEIRDFKSKNFWLVKATFQAQAGTYAGTWFDPDFMGEGKAERIWEKLKAEQIATACLGRSSTVTDQSKQVTKNCPALYDLTTLQREANQKLGFSAAHTLKIAQALYENYKVLTYPRTDARVLPDDYVPVAQDTMNVLSTHHAPMKGFASQVLANGWIKPDKRIFNSAKVTDHFAIIPTTNAPTNLPADEAALYNLVARRFVAVFFPAAEYLETERISRVECEDKVINHFKSRGKVTQKAGWTVVYGADAEPADDQEFEAALPAVDATERPPVKEAKVVAEKTKPPLRYTEASILSAMESAGRGIEDEDLKDAMAGRGLGTPATRAAILEGLIHSEYLVRKKKELHPTDKAFALLARLKTLALDSLCSPELTGEWEYKLHQMEQGKFQRTAFMKEIHANVSGMVAKVKSTAPKLEASPDLCCPTCKKPLEVRPEAYCCPDRHVYLNKQIARRTMTVEEFKTLTSTGTVGPLEGFVSKLGKSFTARLIINEKGYPAFDFGPKEEPAKTLNIGQCKVGVGERFYAVEKRGVKFTVGRQMLQRPISENELEDVLLKGRTGLLSNFISKAGRPFSAYLVLKNGREVGFEFES